MIYMALLFRPVLTDSGIVGILGSGANCAYFDGKKLEKNNFGLGFIFGDEGSC